MTSPVGLKLLLADVVQVARARPAIVLAIVLAGAVPPMIFDVDLPYDMWKQAQALFGLVTLYLQLLLTCASLRHFGLLPARYDPRRPTLGRYPATFALSLLYLLGVACGTVALVLPGLLLIVRWSISLPAMVSEDTRVFTGLRRSWDLTRPHWIGAAKMLLAGSVPLMASALVVGWLYPEYGQPSWAEAAVSNLFVSAGLALLWLLAVCFYRRALIASQGVEHQPLQGA